MTKNWIEIIKYKVSKKWIDRRINERWINKRKMNRLHKNQKLHDRRSSSPYFFTVSIKADIYIKNT